MPNLGVSCYAVTNFTLKTFMQKYIFIKCL